MSCFNVPSSGLPAALIEGHPGPFLLGGQRLEHQCGGLVSGPLDQAGTVLRITVWFHLWNGWEAEVKHQLSWGEGWFGPQGLPPLCWPSL